MNIGTARQRLLGNLLWEMSRQLGLNTCFRCGRLIRQAADWSIDHRKPWRGKDALLFWAISNIVFSHRRCNSRHRRDAGRSGVTILGLPISTAYGRLRKDILFSLAGRLNMVRCIRCADPIDRREFSIDHREPWLFISPALFWSFDNIAFSHGRCNRIAQRRGADAPGTRAYADRRMIIGPAGTAWCSIHMAFLPISTFRINRDKRKGLQARCRDCENSRRNQLRQTQRQHNDTQPHRPIVDFADRSIAQRQSASSTRRASGVRIPLDLPTDL